MPLVVTAERVMLLGNVWLEAATLAGYTDVPVIVADHLSAAEADAVMLAQVQLVEGGEWDERLLGEVLRDLTVQGLDFDVSITGFDALEIDLKVAALADGEDAEEDVEPQTAEPAVSRPWKAAWRCASRMRRWLVDLGTDPNLRRPIDGSARRSDTSPGRLDVSKLSAKARR